MAAIVPSKISLLSNSEIGNSFNLDGAVPPWHAYKAVLIAQVWLDNDALMPNILTGFWVIAGHCKPYWLNIGMCSDGHRGLMSQFNTSFKASLLLIIDILVTCEKVLKSKHLPRYVLVFTYANDEQQDLLSCSKIRQADALKDEWRWQRRFLGSPKLPNNQQSELS
jgi:hypothetical protein